MRTIDTICQNCGKRSKWLPESQRFIIGSSYITCYHCNYQNYITDGLKDRIRKNLGLDFKRDALLMTGKKRAFKPVPPKMDYRLRKAHLEQLADLALDIRDEEWFYDITEKLKGLFKPD